MSTNEPTNMGHVDFQPDRVWNAGTEDALRASAARVRDAFANYLDGTGLDAKLIATALPALLDALEHARLTPKEVDEETLKQITDNFDAYARKRAADLIQHQFRDDHTRKIAEIAFCLGYKAGVVDLSAVQRGQ